jgi:hypothetical protein
MTILDQISRSQRAVPVTVDEVIALQIATRLLDAGNSGWYLHEARRQGSDRMLRAFRQSAPAADGAAARFRSLLQN